MIKKLVLLGAALAATAFAGGDDVFDNDAGERYFCPASGASCLPEGQANLFQGAVISGLLVPTITATSQCKEALKNVYAISSSLAASKLQSFSWHKRELGASVSSSGVPPCKKLLLALDAARDSCLEFAEFLERLGGENCFSGEYDSFGSASHQGPDGKLGFDDMFGLCPRDRDDGFCPFTLRELLSIARLSKALVKGLEGLKAAELAALKLLTEIGTLGEAPCYGKVGLHFNNDKDDRQHHRQLGTTAGAPAPSWKAPVASISCVARNCKICGLITKLIAAFSNALGQITYIDVVLETRSVFLDDKDSQ